jgi:hypothetical protein
LDFALAAALAAFAVLATFGGNLSPARAEAETVKAAAIKDGNNIRILDILRRSEPMP